MNNPQIWVLAGMANGLTLVSFAEPNLDFREQET